MILKNNTHHPPVFICYLPTDAFQILHNLKNILTCQRGYAFSCLNVEDSCLFILTLHHVRESLCCRVNDKVWFLFFNYKSHCFQVCQITLDEPWTSSVMRRESQNTNVIKQKPERVVTEKKGKVMIGKCKGKQNKNENTFN